MKNRMFTDYVFPIVSDCSIFEVDGMANKYFDILRAPHQVAFDITNNCNLRCLHCFNSSGENDVISEELADSEVLQFMKSLAEMNVYNVCFCGGETLLRKELMCDCLSILKPSGAHCTAVSNGILAKPQIIQELVYSGLDGIQFSLDGCKYAHERLRNRKGSFSAVIDAISYVLNETNLRLSVAFTPTGFNIDDFSDVYNTLSDLFENSKRKGGSDIIDLRLQPLMLLGRAKDNHDIVPTDTQYRKLVYCINEHNLSGKYHSCIDVKWGDPIDHLMRFRDTNYFMDQVSVHANGDIVVSAYLPLIVGSIRKHTLEEYWGGGLNTIWTTNIVQYIASKVQSVYDMEQITTLVSDINMDGCLNIDILENDYNDLNLIKEVILEEYN